MNPLLVGEVNPYGADPAFALYPYPRGASGDRLREILGLTTAEYLRRFDRANLCSRKWDAAAARGRATDLLGERPGGTFVLLGVKVQSAFGVDRTREPHATFITLPHPSGRSRAWNVPGARESARLALQSAGCL